MPKYTITVETLSTSAITVEAPSKRQALAIAKRAAQHGDMIDDPPEYDWPTAKVERAAPDDVVDVLSDATIRAQR